MNAQLPMSLWESRRHWVCAWHAQAQSWLLERRKLGQDLGLCYGAMTETQVLAQKAMVSNTYHAL